VPLSPAPRRVARCTLGVLVATSAAAAGHALAGGRVTPAGICGAVALLMAPAWLLAGRRRDWLTITASQLVGQEVVHAVLGGAGAPGALLPHDLMLPLHVIAAMLAAAWLQVGERRAFAAVRRVVAAWLWCLRPRISAVAAAPTLRPMNLPGAGGIRLRHALVRRGPPALTG
jgi:hypothetical protein